MARKEELSDESSFSGCQNHFVFYRLWTGSSAVTEVRMHGMEQCLLAGWHVSGHSQCSEYEGLSAFVFLLHQI